MHQLRQAAVELPGTVVPVRTRAAAFITRCSLLLMTFGARKIILAIVKVCEFDYSINSYNTMLAN